MEVKVQLLSKSAGTVGRYGSDCSTRYTFHPFMGYKIIILHLPCDIPRDNSKPLSYVFPWYEALPFVYNVLAAAV